MMLQSEMSVPRLPTNGAPIANQTHICYLPPRYQLPITDTPIANHRCIHCQSTVYQFTTSGTTIAQAIGNNCQFPLPSLPITDITIASQPSCYIQHWYMLYASHIVPLPITATSMYMHYINFA